MMSAAAVSSLRVLRIRELQPLLGVGAVGGDQRHHADPGLEPGQAQHQQRERQQRRARARPPNPPPPAVSASVHADQAPPAW